MKFIRRRIDDVCRKEFSESFEFRHCKNHHADKKTNDVENPFNDHCAEERIEGNFLNLVERATAGNFSKPGYGKIRQVTDHECGACVSQVRFIAERLDKKIPADCTRDKSYE